VNSSNQDEQSRLDSALVDSENLLIDSLRLDDQRRHRRRLILVTLFLGGLVMVSTIMAVLAGWLTLATPPPANAVASEDEKPPIERAEELSQHGWQLWKEHKYGDAAQQFKQAVELDPEAADSWNGLGWARLNGGNSDRA